MGTEEVIDHYPSSRTPLQDLACAVLGNLFCDPEAAADRGGRAANFDLLDDGAAHKLLVSVQTCTRLLYGARLHVPPRKHKRNNGHGRHNEVTLLKHREPFPFNLHQDLLDKSYCKEVEEVGHSCILG